MIELKSCDRPNRGMSREVLLTLIPATIVTGSMKNNQSSGCVADCLVQLWPMLVVVRLITGELR